MKPRLARLCDRQHALTSFQRYYLLKNKLRDRMIKQLLNSVIAKYRDSLVSRRSIICLSLQLRQIIDLLATDKSRYFAQPRPIIANCYLFGTRWLGKGLSHNRKWTMLHQTLPSAIQSSNNFFFFFFVFFLMSL